MELYPINVARLNVLEAAAFINRFIADFEKSGLNTDDDVELKLQLDDLNVQLPTFIKAVKQTKASAETAQLKALDKRRDRKFAVVKRFTSAYEYSDYDDELAAYRQVSIIIKEFKLIKKANYMAETLAIELFIKKVRNEKNDAMNKLLLQPAIDNLEVANEAFRTIFNQRSSREISKEKYNTTELRTAIFDTYKSLASYILIKAKIKKTPYYITSLNVLNYGREYFADLLAHRKGVLEKRKLKKEKVEVL